MTRFLGRMQGSSMDPKFVTVEIGDDARLRIVAGRRRMGTWPLNQVDTERTSIYRFTLRLEDEVFEFFPEDPVEFADAAGAVVNLSEIKGRFGPQGSSDGNGCQLSTTSLAESSHGEKGDRPRRGCGSGTSSGGSRLRGPPPSTSTRRVRPFWRVRRFVQSHAEVAVLGDSSVTAPGVERAAETWAYRIAERIARTGRYVVLRSFAVGGSMAHDLVRDQLEPALDFKPDVVLVSVGANDAIKGASKRRFTRSLNSLIEELGASGAIVIQSGVGDLGTIPRLYPPLRSLITARAEAFDRIHKTVAAKHGTHVVEQRADGREPWLTDRGLWAADLFHVSGRGHEIWANLAWATLEPHISGLDGSR